MVNEINISQKICKLRNENGYSQEELAEKLKVPSRYISYWEDGVTPELSIIVQLSDIFNVSTDYLLKDDEDDSVSEEVVTSEEVQETQEVVQEVQTDDEILETYINKRKSRVKNVAYAISFAIWAIIPLVNYDFDIGVIFDFTEGALFKIIGIVVFCICVLFVLVCLFVEDDEFDNIDFSDFTFDSSKEYKLKCMYNDFKTKNKWTILISVIAGIIAIITMILTLTEPLNSRDFATYVIVDIMLFIIGIEIYTIIDVKNSDATYKKILKEIEKGEFKETQLGKMQGSIQVAESEGMESDDTNSDAWRLEEYIVDRKIQAKKIFDSIVLMCVSTIPLAYFYYDIEKVIQNKSISELTTLLMITFIVAGAFGAIIHFIAVVTSNPTLKLNQNGGLVLNNTEKIKFNERYKTFKKDSSDTLVGGIAIFIVIAVISNIAIGVFNMGNIMRFIAVDILIIFAGYIVGTIVSAIYEKKGYKKVISYVGEVQGNRISPKNKKGVKTINATEVDEYISGNIRCGKNYMGLPIFLALGITPYLMYFYSYGKVFNGEVFEALPIFIIVISVICVLVALYLIIKTKNFNAKFKSNNNYDFILNEFAENKLKFIYEKFKTKRIGKIILSIVIYLIAIVSNIYVCFMFNGSINMLYILLSVTVFLYGIATYFVITIKYEQNTYKILLNNVD